jgi:hypothetical protein
MGDLPTSWRAKAAKMRADRESARPGDPSLPFDEGYETALIECAEELERKPTYTERAGLPEALLSSVFLGLLQEWAALDGGSWHVERHARSKAALMARTKAAIAQAKELTDA